jgi:DNA polymerase elongation subunit (family B)
VFSGWKIVAEEVKHPNSSYLPAIVSTVLNKRIPFHDDIQLTRWYGYNAGRERWRVLHYRLTQAMACLLLFDALDIAGRAAEAASLSGVEFSQSFPGIRGSQYKVEGVLLRALQSINSCERGVKRGYQKTTLSVDSKKLAIDRESSLSSESKSQTQSPWKVRRRSAEGHEDNATGGILGGNYFFFSPSIQDCSRQEALECQALTLEPQSGCHDDPVVVCDFTALYPSLIIAYNICYSTCAGKLDYHSTRNEMCQEGRTTGRIGPMMYSEARTATVLKDHMKSLFDSEKRDESCGTTRSRDRAYAAPTGTIFVSENVLHGVLPQVLNEMLKTREMLKKASKQYKKLIPNVAPSILRQLEARQLGT